jgi:anti-anti-sigma factor
MGDSARILEDVGLTVRVERDREALVISPVGELDLANAKTLENELRRAMGSDASAVVLDLGGLSFIDSTGLRALLVAAKLSQMNGRRLRMVRVAPIRRAIEVSGLERSLPLVGMQ